MKYDHLHPDTSIKLESSDEKRIEMLTDPVWIGYPRAIKIMGFFEKLFRTSKRPRMPNLLLVGPTNNGKTSILRRFEALHPINDNLESDAALVPIVSVSAPPVPDESSFYDAILHQFTTPTRPRDHARNKRFQVIQILKKVGTRILIIDEIQDLLAGDSKKQLSLLNVIKHLGNELEIPIIASGVQSALNAIQVDPQLANRFEPIALPRWEFNDDFRSLLASFESVIPLKKPSVLVSLKLSQKIFFMSEGTIGEISMLLAKAAEISIQTQEERITLKTLDEVEWILPSERRRKVELSIQ